MINILVANDDRKVIKKILEVIKDMNIDDNILTAESYQETLKILQEKDINKLILDITMPTYRIKKHDDGGRFRRGAGIDILNRIKLYNIKVSVLLLTRLGQFYDSKDLVKNDFSSIQEDIENKKWPFCVSIVRFEDNVQIDWKNKINYFIMEQDYA